MPPKKPSQTPARASRAAAKVSALQRATPNEAAAILRVLLARHPDLRREAEAMAIDMMATSNEASVADGIAHAIRTLDYSDLNDRSGDHGGVYVAPEEAADELLWDAIEGYVADMHRQAALGLVEAAERGCIGIVTGLYRADEAGAGDCLGWAPDFPSEAASRVVAELARALPAEAAGELGERVGERFAEVAPRWASRLVRGMDGTGRQRKR